MAKVNTMGLEQTAGQLERLGRVGIRQIVEKGTATAMTMMRAQTMAHHKRTGALMDSITASKLYESLNSASQFVDFEGDHGKGITNRDLAWLLDNDPHKGDRFISSDEKAIEKAVTDAMQEESDRLLAEIGG